MRGENEGIQMSMAIDRQIGIWQALDTKAGVLVGFVVASVAEILGFLILAATEPSGQSMQTRPLPPGLMYWVGAGLVFVVLAAVLGVVALVPRTFRQPVEPGQNDQAEYDVLEEIRKKTRRKGRLILCCGVFVVIGVILQTVAALRLLGAMSKLAN
jgi:Kef-type K+ transport system membrane component KefB